MNKPIIVLTGSPAWREVLRDVVDELGFALEQYTTTESYIPKLADDHAALIVVDGDHGAWRHWTTSPRVNAATRRIPIVMISESADVRSEALTVGADFALTPADLREKLPAIVDEHARVIDESFRAEMASQCGQPLPPEALDAVAKFNRGEYYKQHDLFEALWMQETGPVRDLYRAILQVGIAYYQVQRSNRMGALKMILRSIQWLKILPDVCQGVDVAALRQDAARLRTALEAWPADRDFGEFDQGLLGVVRMVESES